MAMGIAEAARLYERIEALEARDGLSVDVPVWNPDRVSVLERQVAELTDRLDKIESRSKPGRKPKVPQ